MAASRIGMTFLREDTPGVFVTDFSYALGECETIARAAQSAPLADINTYQTCIVDFCLRVEREDPEARDVVFGMATNWRIDIREQGSGNLRLLADVNLTDTLIYVYNPTTGIVDVDPIPNFTLNWAQWKYLQGEIADYLTLCTLWG